MKVLSVPAAAAATSTPARQERTWDLRDMRDLPGTFGKEGTPQVRGVRRRFTGRGAARPALGGAGRGRHGGDQTEGPPRKRAQVGPAGSKDHRVLPESRT
ncbi:hypothetical protein GCM10010519_54170 [Streptomyces lactacystinicus]